MHPHHLQVNNPRGTLTLKSGLYTDCRSDNHMKRMCKLYQEIYWRMTLPEHE